MLTTYTEKPPSPVRIREHDNATIVVHKRNFKTPRPSEQIKVEPPIVVKYLLVDNIDGHVILFQVMKLLELLNLLELSKIY